MVCPMNTINMSVSMKSINITNYTYSIVDLSGMFVQAVSSSIQAHSTLPALRELDQITININNHQYTHRKFHYLFQRTTLDSHTSHHDNHPQVHDNHPQVHDNHPQVHDGNTQCPPDHRAGAMPQQPPHHRCDAPMVTVVPTSIPWVQCPNNNCNGPIPHHQGRDAPTVIMMAPSSHRRNAPDPMPPHHGCNAQQSTGQWLLRETYSRGHRGQFYLEEELTKSHSVSR